MITRRNELLTAPIRVRALPDADQTEMTGGLTKREYFAALALQGYIAGLYAGNNAGFTVEGNATAAVEAADALIEALNRSAV